MFNISAYSNIDLADLVKWNLLLIRDLRMFKKNDY
jgi:hypothetical protein